MNSTDDDADLEAKYHLVKKKYQELKKLRIDSVAADTEDLRKKVEEHRRVHELAVQELREQNQALKNLVTESERTRAEIERISDSNAHLLRQLQLRDPILKVILKYPDFRVRILSQGKYEISYRDGKDYVFILSQSPGPSDSIEYSSVRYPPRLARQPNMDFVGQKITFSSSELVSFCTLVSRAVKNCH